MKDNNFFPLYIPPKDIGPDYGAINRDLAELVFSTIEANGFLPYHGRFGDTYFIWQGEPNSRITFEVKGIWMPGWLFGLWIDSPSLLDLEVAPEYPVIKLFAQHKNRIDKFKPSDSPFVVEWTKEEVMDFLTGTGTTLPPYDLRDMLFTLRDHPFIAYGIDYPGDLCVGHPSKMYAEDIVYSKWHELDEAVKGNFYKAWAEGKAGKLSELDGVRAFVETASEGEWLADGKVRLVVEFDPAKYDEDLCWDIVENFFDRNDYGKIHRDYPGDWDPACRIEIYCGDREFYFE